MPRTILSRIAFTTAILALALPAVGDEPAVLRDLQAFFGSPDDDEREEIARRIEADPDFDRARLGRDLHRVEFFKPLPPGPAMLHVQREDGGRLPVIVRIPKSYDPSGAYPLIYALHGQGGGGTDIIGYLEHVLADRIDQYIVAAPDAYQQVIIQSTTPPSAEHLLALNEVRKTVHIDSNRVYILGYSQGGHAAWTLAVLHPDQFAGVAAVAGSLLLQDYGELAEIFLPNLAATRLYACWGQKDTLEADGRTPSADGGIAGLNRRICELGASLRLPLKWYEVPDVGHGGVVPPMEDLLALLTAKREPYPKSICRVFRLLYQGRTAWIEARDWQGPWWDQKPVKIRFNADENPDDPVVQRAARARSIRSLLGELRGDVENQEIKVYRKRIGELAVWITDGMIDWNRPIVLTVNGRKSFEGQVQPDLFVCLSQAARTYDFDRLYWSGLYFKSGSKAKVITGRTPFPPVPLTPE